MNITAVARKARVSTATVSRVINGTAVVSPKTAERVRHAIKALNFYPNTNARALGSGRSSLYGLIISDITNPFFPELVKAFEDVAVQHGQEVLIGNTNYDSSRMEHCVSRMLQRKVDGVAIMTSEMDDNLIQAFSGRKIPLVFMDTGKIGPGISNLRVDYQAGVSLAMEHLIQHNHRHIAFISGPQRLPSAKNRFVAFTEAMQQHQLTVQPGMIQEANHRVEGGHEAMQRIFQSGLKPTAVLASNDLTAIGALGAIVEHGLRVPEDISVVGFDDIQLSSYTQPTLTTLALPRVEMAEVAFRSLYANRGKHADELPQGQVYMFQPKLVIRKSTGPALL